MWLSNSANLAIFFLIIRMVYRVPDENSQIGAKGSTINNFTFLHPAFTSSSSDLKPQVSEDSENIKIACYSISFCGLR